MSKDQSTEAAKAILEKHCPSMNLLYLDDTGIAFRDRILAAMAEHSASLLIEAQERIKDLEDAVKKAIPTLNWIINGDELDILRKALSPVNPKKKEDASNL